MKQEHEIRLYGRRNAWTYAILLDGAIVHVQAHIYESVLHAATDAELKARTFDANLVPLGYRSFISETRP